MTEKADGKALPVVPAAGPARDITGVDQTSLTQQQRQDVWDVAQQTYAPCENEAVSLVQCVEEQRSCATCRPALDFLIDEIKGGSARANARAAVKLRFDPELVVDLEIGTSPTKGPASAPITIVVFSDFECPGCKAVVPVLEALQAKQPQDIRLVHKFFPLKQHVRARYAALAAWAAQQQGKYWEMEKLIFENQKTLQDEDLARFAEQLGLDMVKWRADKDSQAALDTVDADVEQGDASGLARTPWVLINGRAFDSNYFRYDEDLEPWIALEKKLVASGTSAAPSPAPASTVSPTAPAPTVAPAPQTPPSATVAPAPAAAPAKP